MIKNMRPLLFVLLICCFSYTYSQVKGETIFSSKTVDLGRISSQQTAALAYFDFCNNTKGLLVVQKVRTTCGCTIVSYPIKPLKEMEKGRIKVILNTKGLKGTFQKSIMIVFNGLAPILLKVKGEVSFT